VPFVFWSISSLPSCRLLIGLCPHYRFLPKNNRDGVYLRNWIGSVAGQYSHIPKLFRRCSIFHFIFPKLGSSAWPGLGRARPRPDIQALGIAHALSDTDELFAMVVWHICVSAASVYESIACNGCCITSGWRLLEARRM
jgi:hypothetical protein